MFDGEAFGRAIVEAVRAHLDQVTASMLAEIEALKAQIALLRSADQATATNVAQATESIRGLQAVVDDLTPSPSPTTIETEVVRELVAELVGEAVAAIPKAKDGENGVGVAGAVIDRDGALVLTLSDGKTCNLGRVVGEEGKSAVGDVDFEAELQGDGRTVTLRFVQGDVAQAYDLTFPVTIDAGVYRDGQDYQKGDGVTWAGSYWIAQRETKAKPGEGDDWRLSVKRGRDGRDVPQEKRVAGPIPVGVPKEAAQ